MKNVVVMFGGASPERDISIITGVQCMQAIDKDDYNIIPIFCDDGWNMLYSKHFMSIDTFRQNKIVAKKVFFYNGCLYLFGRIKKRICKVDCALLCFHGGYGEGGGIQGLLDICGIPYTSASLLSSAILQDKCTFKDLISFHHLPTVDYINIFEDEFLTNKQGVIDKINCLGYPVIIKPSKLGSSIGIEIVYKEEELFEKMANAFSYGTKVLVEKYLKNFVEINCACYRDNGEIVVSKCELVKKHDKILSYNDKYMGGSKSMDSMTRQLEPTEYTMQTQKIKQISRQIYDIFDLSGIVRIDYMVCDDNIFVNEVNTIPGSLANYLFECDYDVLLSKLIHNAQIQHFQSRSKISTIASSVLNNFESKKLMK